MSSTFRVIVLSCVAFAAPIAVVALQHRDKLEALLTIDPHTTQGKVLYFYAPT